MAKPPRIQSPLFPNAGRQLTGRRSGARSALGQLLSAATRTKTGRSPAVPDPRRAARELLGSATNSTAAGALAELARLGFSGQSVWQKLLGALGPAGRLLGGLIGPLAALRSVSKSEIAEVLRVAQALLEAWGYRVQGPTGGPRRTTLSVEPEPAEDPFSPPPAPPRRPPPPAQPPPPPATGRGQFAGTSATGGGQGGGANGGSGSGRGGSGGGRSEGPYGGGAGDDDLIMFLAPHSSNVYAYGYRRSSNVLFIRYWHVTRDQSRSPGPLYRYSPVPERVFWKMHEASSKGRFVWDDIRIRGTVSGHQYDYALIGIRDGYVPRKATLRAGGEWFVPREITVRGGRVRKSELPEVQVNRLVRAPLNPRGPRR